MPHKRFVIVTILFSKERDGRWTAECAEFGTATFGDTLEEAKENILEALDLHLNTLEETGEFDRFVREHNIKVHTARPKKVVRVEAPIDRDIFFQPYVHELCEA